MINQCGLGGIFSIFLKNGLNFDFFKQPSKKNLSILTIAVQLERRGDAVTVFKTKF